MQPSVVPRKPESIPFICFRIRKTAPERVVQRAQFRPPGTLRLHDRIARVLSDELGQRNPRPGQHLQDKGHPQWGIPADMQRRQHHPAVALAADQRPLLPHGTSNVSLPHRRPDEPGLIIPRRVLDHQAGGQVHHYCGRFTHLSRLARPVRLQHRPHRERQRIVLARGRSCLIHQGQSVHVRVDRHPDVGLRFPHQPSQLYQVFGNRFRCPRKAAVGLEVDTVHLTPELLEQRRNRPPAGTAHAIERHPESPRPDLLDVDHRETEDVREVPLQRRGILPHHAESLPAVPHRALLGQRAHRGTGIAIEEDPVRAHELERVPFDRVVARREDEPGAGVVLLHRHLHRRRRHDAEVDHVHAHRHEPRRRGVREHRSAGPRVAPQHHHRLPLAPGPRTQRRRVTGDEFGREVGSHMSAHPGHADHERR